MLHFGIFNILAGSWRQLGARCDALFRAPLRSRSLTEFWGRRWNLAFSEMTALGIFRPLEPRLGRSGATAAAFLSLDLDLALAPGELERLGALFGPPIRTERFEHSLNLSAPGSDLRIQFQIDPRYHDFPARAEVRDVLGHQLPVAKLDDVLRGKVWTASDPGRRASKRQKDLADIARLLGNHPELREHVPQSLLRRLFE